MVDQRLAQYIKTQLSRGASRQSIEGALLRSGYGLSQIDEVFSSIKGLEVHHTIHFSSAVVGVFIALILAGLGFGYFVWDANGSQKENKLLDINLEPLETEVFAGEEIEVLKEVTNMGSAKGYDVILKTEILDSKNGKVIASKTETRAIETIGSTKTSLLIPMDAQPGEYVVRLIADYDGKKAVATLPVTIKKRAQQETEVKKENEVPIEVSEKKEDEEVFCSDFDPCTSDTQREGKCEYAPIVPCCPNNLCEQNEICPSDCPSDQGSSGSFIDSQGIKQSATIDQIKLIAQENPSKAAQMCADQKIPDYKDSCFSGVAKVSGQNDFCARIENERIKDVCLFDVAKLTQNSASCDSLSKEDRKDSCYLTFVLDYDDYSVCEKITNENLRQNCFALKGMQ